ncbi:hypothetical protein SUGI_0100530 [Cryptomeria japonica]|nr:hypothetical protein SUGI_0100530 [Cryptomeria japonica]
MSTDLYKAAVSGEVAALEEMRKKNVDIFAQFSHRGDTALHISAFYGRAGFVKWLLQYVREQSDVEANQQHSFLRAQNEEGNSALHEALKGGDHAQIVEMLIEVDAELAGIRNNKGESPLFTASAYGRSNALTMLFPRTDPRYYARFLDGQTCLHHALLYQSEEVAKTLIEKAPQLCKLADYFLGRTPLHIAALHGCSKSIVHMLLQCDTSSSFTKDKNKQQTALHLAAQHGHTDIVRCILNFAEDCLEIRDKDGKTALHYAVENAKVGVVRYLVSFARVINIADKNGYTALDIANQKFEEEPLSPYFAIWWFLSGKNGIAGVEVANQTRETLNPFPSDEKYSTKINSLSVCAILIATVTFQAAFTLPAHDKKRALSAQISFQGFVFFDWLAFCFSMAAAILLAYATFFRRHRSLAVGASAAILSMALYSMMISFSLAIFLQLMKDYYKLAVFFFGAMFLLAPIAISVILVVLHNAIGFRVSEFIRPGLLRIVRAGQSIRDV